MMKKFSIVFFICYIFCFSVVEASENAVDICVRNMQNPKVTINTSYGKLQYNHTKNKRSITRLHVSKNKAGLNSGQLLNGLSTYNVTGEFSFELRKQTLPSGITCVYPTKINLFFGVGEDPVIYIAKNIHEDSCAYQVVLRHEQTHQQTNQSILEYYIPIMKKEFIDVVRSNAIAAKNGDVDMAAAKKELQSKYAKVINRFLQEIKLEMNEEQSKLDTESNYSYERQLCADSSD